MLLIESETNIVYITTHDIIKARQLAKNYEMPKVIAMGELGRVSHTMI